jgi:hypothetical protein
MAVNIQPSPMCQLNLGILPGRPCIRVTRLQEALGECSVIRPDMIRADRSVEIEALKKLL